MKRSLVNTINKRNQRACKVSFHVEFLNLDILIGLFEKHFSF